MDTILNFLTPGTIELLGSTESKTTEDKNGENVPHLEIFKNPEFQEIKVWFQDQNFKPLQVEDKINLTLVII